jgi:glycine/D-amino acid oxidase-like deaminating enzyme
LRAGNIVPIVPDSFLLFSAYASALLHQFVDLKLRLGSRFFEELRMPRHWQPDDISPFERVRILDPRPIERFNRAGLKHLARAFPAFAGARLQQSWAGLIDVTPDAVPVIGPIESVPGFFLASGFSGHGFGLGPGAGKLMAQIVMGEKTCVDCAPFRFDRLNTRREATAAAADHVDAAYQEGTES